MSRKTINPPSPEASQEELERLVYVTKAADRYFDFYNSQVPRYAWWHGILTVATLLGTALTPILALFPYGTNGIDKFWIALPSGIAGLAAAANAAFRLKDEWAQDYFTLSAIEIERDRFLVRASPEYSADKSVSEVITNFENRLGQLVMSEVGHWRQETTRSSGHAVKTD